MTKIVPGLYIGSLENAKDEEELIANCISHILVVQDTKVDIEKLPSRHYLQIVLNEKDNRSLLKCIPIANDFIHGVRVELNNILVCSDSGMSANMAVVAAYLMTVYEMSYKSALHCLQGIRHAACPVSGLKEQLELFDDSSVCQFVVTEDDGCHVKSPVKQQVIISAATERERILKNFGQWSTLEEDQQIIKNALESHKSLIASGVLLNELTVKSSTAENGNDFPQSELMDRSSHLSRDPATFESDVTSVVEPEQHFSPENASNDLELFELEPPFAIEDLVQDVVKSRNVDADCESNESKRDYVTEPKIFGDSDDEVVGSITIPMSFMNDKIGLSASYNHQSWGLHPHRSRFGHGMNEQISSYRPLSQSLIPSHTYNMPIKSFAKFADFGD